MTPLSVVLVVSCVASGAWGCKFFCKNPSTGSYECCDGGNPWPTQDPVVEPVEPVAPVLPAQPGAGSACYYWCSYAGEAYCCGDASQPIPASHDDHEGTCVPEVMQTCKTSGVFYLKGGDGLLLLEGAVKDAPSCASDGYCASDERCCASPCAKRHVCLKTQEEALQGQ